MTMPQKASDYTTIYVAGRLAGRHPARHHPEQPYGTAFLYITAEGVLMISDMLGLMSEFPFSRSRISGADLTLAHTNVSLVYYSARIIHPDPCMTASVRARTFETDMQLDVLKHITCYAFSGHDVVQCREIYIERLTVPLQDAA